MTADSADRDRPADRLALAQALAKPVQHDLNNLLTVVFANLEMLKRTAAEGAPRRQVGRIEEAARRFQGTTRALLSLVRREAGTGVARLSQVIEELRPLLMVLLPAPGALRLDLVEDDPLVPLDRIGFDLALLDLARGAGGTGLHLAVRAAAGAGATLTVAAAAGPALTMLGDLTLALGGTVAPTEGGLVLTLPAAAP